MKNSDFANSPVALREELDILEELEFEAEDAGKDEESYHSQTPHNQHQYYGVAE